MSRNTIAILIVVGIMLAQIIASTVYMTLWIDSKFSSPFMATPNLSSISWKTISLGGIALVFLLAIVWQFWSERVQVPGVDVEKNDEPGQCLAIVAAEAIAAVAFAISACYCE